MINEEDWGFGINTGAWTDEQKEALRQVILKVRKLEGLD